MKNHILIRLAQLTDAKKIAEISVNGWRAAYKNILPESYLSAISYEDRWQQWINHLQAMKAGDNTRTALVAESNNEVIGYICGGVSRETALPFDAELYAIYVEPNQKQKGMGSQLVWAFVEWLKEQRYQSMFCRALERNPSRIFYEKLGGELLNDKIAKTFHEKLLIEVAYGWKNLRFIKK